MSRILNSMQLEFLSIRQNLGLARVTVAAFASQLDFTLSDLEEIKVAVSEAVTNAMVHGYGSSPVGLIRIVCNLLDDALEIIVSDEGGGIGDVPGVVEPARAAESERVGLGFVFMRSFMNEVKVDSEPGKGTQVKMVRRLPLQLRTAGQQN